MSDQTSQEPTMEEILASIRRIISEDDAPADTPAPDAGEPEEAAAEAPAFAPEPTPEPEPEPAPEPFMASEPEPEDDALELTDRVDQVGDLDIYSPTTAPASAEPESAAYAPEPAAYAPPAAAPSEDSLLSQTAATAAASAFGQLSAAIGMPHSDRTLEDVVRELLRPLLKQWLDDNLPGIVETAVREEVERIARGRVR
jgi:cell pole-organizing protein PopZ